MFSRMQVVLLMLLSLLSCASAMPVFNMNTGDGLGWADFAQTVPIALGAHGQPLSVFNPLASSQAWAYRHARASVINRAITLRMIFPANDPVYAHLQQPLIDLTSPITLVQSFAILEMLKACNAVNRGALPAGPGGMAICPCVMGDWGEAVVAGTFSLLLGAFHTVYLMNFPLESHCNADVFVQREHTPTGGVRDAGQLINRPSSLLGGNPNPVAVLEVKNQSVNTLMAGAAQSDVHSSAGFVHESLALAALSNPMTANEVCPLTITTGINPGDYYLICIVLWCTVIEQLPPNSQGPVLEVTQAVVLVVKCPTANFPCPGHNGAGYSWSGPQNPGVHLEPNSIKMPGRVFRRFIRHFCDGQGVHHGGEVNVLAQLDYTPTPN